MEDRIGQQLGNYKLLRLVGQGGFADVYLGEHIHLRTQAAIKVLQVRLGESSTQNFLTEARTIAHLVHPYIIRVLDFGVQDNVPFLVMDYAPHGTFRQRFLQGKPLPPAPLVPYMKQVAAALQYGHEKKLIHRDVKPENMLLSSNDEVLLSDFGLALIAYNSVSRSPTETAGTAAYMAPEQLQGKPRPASDQYAVGIIAYEWLTGTCPFEGSFFEIASQQVLSPPPSIREKVPGTPVEIEKVVMRALEKDPQKRFANTRDFALALEDACLATHQYSIDLPASLTFQKKTPNAATPNNSSIVTTFPASSLERLPLQEKSPSPRNIPNGARELAKERAARNSEIFPASAGQSFQAHLNNVSGITASAFTESQKRASITNLDPSMSEAQYKSLSGLPQYSPAQNSQIGVPFSSGSSTQVEPRSQIPSQNSAIFSPIPTSPAKSAGQTSMSGLPPFAVSKPAEGIRPNGIGTQNSVANLPLYPRSAITGLATQEPAPAPFSPAAAAILSRNLADRPVIKETATKEISAPLATKRIQPVTIAIVSIVVLIIVGSAVGLFMMANSSAAQEAAANQKNATATSIVSQATNTAKATQVAQAAQTAQVKIANANPYTSDDTSILVLNDPMTSNKRGWQEGPDPTGFTGGKCIQTDTGYEITAPALEPTPCFLTNGSYGNFAYQVDLTFSTIGQSYSGGGLVFRANSETREYYLFEVFSSGNYSLQKCIAYGGCANYIDGYKLGKPASPFFKPGANVSNTLAIVVKDNKFSLYINKQKVIDATDTIAGAPYTSGTIGVVATGGNDLGIDSATNTLTTALFSNVKIWNL